MKLVSWSIIFVVIIFSFSFAIRINMNNKMDIMQEEIKYNNILDQSTMDATKVLTNQLTLNSKNEEEIVLAAMQKFINSFSVGFGYYGGNNNIRQYIPAIITTTYDGFYVYSLDYLYESGLAPTAYKTEKKYKITKVIKRAGNNAEGMGFDVPLIRREPAYLEHTLKPKIIYSLNDIEHGNIFINFSLDNYVRISKKGIDEKSGYIVDVRHYDDINSSNGLYTKEINYLEKKFRYEKSFMNYNGKKVLLEEWYQYDENNKEELIYRRISSYSDEAYNFTKEIDEKYFDKKDNYLTRGNPENTGFTNPITGEFEIGEFHKKRKEIITNQITEKLKYYVLQHNNVAKNYNITYQFVLPVVQSTDWNNALDDVSVISFVQGIPILGKTYYNNYGFSNARLVDKEVFYGFNGNYGKIYFSSRQFNSYTNYILGSNPKVEFFYSAKDAVEKGYYPYIGQENNYIGNSMKETMDVDINEENDVVNLSVTGNSLITYVGILQGKKEKANFYNNVLTDSMSEDLIKEASFDNDENGNIVSSISINLRKYGITNSNTYTIFIKDLEGNSKIIYK